MADFYSFGECLTRIDVASSGETKLYPTGTALNFLSNIAALGAGSASIVTALSKTRDSQLFKSALLSASIGLDTCCFTDGPMGSYMLFRKSTPFGWEVVYNRAQTVWGAMLGTHDPAQIAAEIPAKAHFHFDGISLCSNAAGPDFLQGLVKSLKKKGCRICFDFNFRRTFGDFEKFRESYERLLGLCDYLHIAAADLDFLVPGRAAPFDKLKALQRKHAGLSAIFGMTKGYAGDLLQVEGFILQKGRVVSKSIAPFAPVELLGTGDAFCAFVVALLAQGKKVDLSAALAWVREKSMLAGDATAPDLKQIAWTAEKRGVVR